MIQNPIEFSEQERAVVEAFLARPSEQCTGDFWESIEVQEFRSRTKAYYIRVQGNRCCYCNQLIRSNNLRLWDLDHIVPRNSHPRFMFEPRNLAAACPDCNTAKGEEQPLKNRRRVTYPSRADDFKIIQAHFDEFDDHLYWNGGSIYLPRSDKGRLTIYVCNLMRFAQNFLVLPARPLDRRFEESVDDLQGFDPAAVISAEQRIAAVITRARERLLIDEVEPEEAAIQAQPNPTQG
jgi:HNH endonuclease